MASRTIPVIGSGQDVAAFMEQRGFVTVLSAQKAGFDIFDWEKYVAAGMTKGSDELNIMNVFWYAGALEKSGNQVIMLTDPAAWRYILEASAKRKGLSERSFSAFLDLEEPMNKCFDLKIQLNVGH